MPGKHTTSSIFAKRLKEARVRSGLTQEQLGIHAGIDEFSASARINQYERGKHLPHLLMGQRLARALHVPTSFLYEEDDLLAALLVTAARLTRGKKKILLANAEMLTLSASPKVKNPSNV
ncbi:helix-turn-helix transcriptional regulator [Paraburkholderia silvatlantica]|uniref:Transcriptional regulator with XRE-family HTH domain n=1 Tax=Paraburkholderia silvatlantica TaxID=321895 RepID=A0ABR6FT27_9BURK|nr:helix-turn-helix transcriptional regulator [Paraburkholderia silvatlantica]MBB2930594.1 transcriptional regulator with XRE-family HTH domain [Paraburkholderia silvatlantica]PVY30396.1 Xre family transcriptional regulator [Paraburkholderia silvatlantica]PXW36867.1 Xre family transcriptional regulator [Paraburkholderia silvatlantica]